MRPRGIMEVRAHRWRLGEAHKDEGIYGEDGDGGGVRKGGGIDK